MRDPKIDQLWDINNLITKDTLVDCGLLSVEFFNDDGSQTTLDPDIFLDDRSNPGAFNFASRYTEDVSKANIYPIKYKVYHTLYDQNFVILADPFIITIIDPCEKPVGLAASTLSAQEYTITDNAKTYQIPEFTSDPVWCDITYTYSITDLAGDEAVSFNDD